MSKEEVEIIARGVCIRDGMVLLCHTQGADNTYLPGGHVDFGESAGAALVREIQEEMGVESHATEFLGAVEHTFEQKGETHCEVNLVFSLEINGLEPGVTPKSREAHIDFLWCDVGLLDETALEPGPIRAIILKWHGEGMTGGWGSSYPDTD